jgi:hypothetical protein
MDIHAESPQLLCGHGARAEQQRRIRALHHDDGRAAVAALLQRFLGARKVRLAVLAGLAGIGCVAPEHRRPPNPSLRGRYGISGQRRSLGW